MSIGSPPQTERAYRKWWATHFEPMERADWPDYDEDDLDVAFDMKRDADVDDGRLPESAREWTRR